jgi:hypothetical protein
MRLWILIACGVTFSAIGCAGCDKSQAAPTAPAGVPVAPAPTPPAIVSWSLAGKRSFTFIGETTQLTAAGTLADGTTVDLTGEVRWAPLSGEVVSISPSGFLTVVGFGRGTIGATYGTKSATQSVTATPAGTFAIAGRVREPGHSALPRVRVLATQSGESVLTDANGEFTLGALVAHGDLRAEHEGFEPLTVAFEKTDPSEDFGGYYDLPMQRIVRIEAGESIKPPPIAPHDVSFKTVEGQCSPCRMIRVIAPAPGVLRVAVYWSAAPGPLFLWVDGIRVGDTSQTNGVSADAPVPAGETIVYVGMTTSTGNTYNSGPYVAIDLATTFTPSGGTN